VRSQLHLVRVSARTNFFAVEEHGRLGGPVIHIRSKPLPLRLARAHAERQTRSRRVGAQSGKHRARVVGADDVDAVVIYKLLDFPAGPRACAVYHPPTVRDRQPSQLFRNLGRRRFGLGHARPRRGEEGPDHVCRIVQHGLRGRL